MCISIWILLNDVKIFEKKAGTILPNPGGPLSDHMPSAAIYSANNKVKDLVYSTVTPSDSRK